MQLVLFEVTQFQLQLRIIPYQTNRHFNNLVPLLHKIDQLDNKTPLSDLLKLQQEIKKTNLRLARHAEENVLLSYHSKTSIRGKKQVPYRKLHLVVIRVNGSGTICDSKPCSNCAELIKNYGIKKITYSTSDGDFITTNINNLTTRKSVGFQSVDNALSILNRLIDNKLSS